MDCKFLDSQPSSNDHSYIFSTLQSGHRDISLAHSGDFTNIWNVAGEVDGIVIVADTYVMNGFTHDGITLGNVLWGGGVSIISSLLFFFFFFFLVSLF